MVDYKKINNYLILNFKNKEIVLDDLESFKEYLNINSFKYILDEIISDDELLELIAERSYTHALGFDKIVLTDLSKDFNIDNKVQLRLHIWHPQEDSLPITESLHEHSFNFISTILSGKLENQSFKISSLSEKEKIVLNTLLKSLENLSEKEKNFLNDQIELLEILKLGNLNSSQYDKSIEKGINRDKILELINSKLESSDFKDEMVEVLTKFQGRYISNRVRGEKKAYKHVFKEYVGLEIDNVLSVSKGDYYFHPYELPHRLYYDNKNTNATVLITTPIQSNPQGGSLQRPTYYEEDEKGYEKISISANDLKNKLLKLRDIL